MVIKKTCILIFSFWFFISSHGQEDINSIKSVQQQNIDQQLLLKVETGDTAAVRIVLKEGPDVNTATYEGVTPLMFSVIYGFYDVAQLLVYYGADVNKTPYDGISPLMVAAENNEIEIGELLILNKANLSQKDKEGFSAIHYAIKNSNYYFVDMLLFYETNIEETTKDRTTPLMMASFYGMKDIAELLITSGANIEAQDNKGFTSLITASQEGHAEIVKILLENGSNTEVKNDYSQTALCYAVKNGYKQIVEMLIDHGADYYITFNNGYNLLYLADKNNHFDIKSLLKEKGMKNEIGLQFEKININSGFNFTGRDVFYELSTGLTESKINLNLNLVYLKRIGYSPVIEEEDNGILQLYENRSLFGFNVEKEIKIFEITNLKQFDILLSAKEMFSYGKFRALNRKPSGKFVFSPSAGINYRDGNFFVRFQYYYLNTGLTDFPANRFSITAGYKFIYKQSIIKEKSISW